ncbi:MAG: TlpA family protein disulfide reductase [Anaerolineae bacterium]|nr:TlpA family protein disulfide reductase [Anaerolineae bacterium]
MAVDVDVERKPAEDYPLLDLELEPEAGAPDEETARPRRGLGFLAVLIIGAIVVMGIIVGIGLSRQGMTQPTSGPAPDFTLDTFDGPPITLSDLRGKVVVLNFWAGWCGPCRDEAPDLQAAWERYQPSGEVVFLGVAWSDMERSARDFLTQFGITYPTGLDVGTRISEQYRITGIPETFFIDRDGDVRYFVMRPMDEAEIIERVDSLLADD